MVYVLIGVGAALVLLAFWMLVVEPRWFRVRRVVRPASEVGLPALRILHLTDTHFSGNDGPLLRFLENLARREPYDLVVYTGDLIESAEGLENLRRAAGLFSPRLGSFAVLGGHDWKRSGFLRVYSHLLAGNALRTSRRENPGHEVIEMMESAGVQVLRDEASPVQPLASRAENGSEITVLGLRDGYMFNSDMEAAWEGVSRSSPVVALSHSPDLVPALARRGANLVLCGHTHGGQVRLPFIGPVITRTRAPRRWARGTFHLDGTTFVVSCGLGASIPSPYRLLCRPEAVIVELTEDPGADPTPVEEA